MIVSFYLFIEMKLIIINIKFISYRSYFRISRIILQESGIRVHV
jgi:hypothetical protein